MPKPADVIPLERRELVLAGTVGLVLVGVVVLVLVGLVGGDPVPVVSAIDLVGGDPVPVVSAIDLVVVAAAVATVCMGTCEGIITLVLYAMVVPETELVRVSIAAPEFITVIMSTIVVAALLAVCVVLLVLVDVTVAVSLIVGVTVSTTSLKPDPDIK